MTKPIIALTAFLMVICLPQLAAADPDKNLETMIKAARELEWALPENRAYLLIKNETIESPVGVIFGYVDNRVACQEIAEALSNPAARVGTFQCHAVY
ncbi:hypothetical protein ACS3QZ_09505 [Shimia sp. W99]